MKNYKPIWTLMGELILCLWQDTWCYPNPLHVVEEKQVEMLYGKPKIQNVFLPKSCIKLIPLIPLITLLSWFHKPFTI